MKAYRVFRTSDSSRPVHISLRYVESCEEINEKEVILRTKSGQKYYVYGDINEVMEAVKQAKNGELTGLLEEKEGLTLRDQFAMAALPALIQTFGKTPLTMTIAYEVADLMLEARKKPKTGKEVSHDN